jgi:uncharacterized protein YbjT (DUF2867 family)
MYVVLGATGNTGEPLARCLLAHGKPVRAVGRNAERLRPLAKLGAEPCVADVRDTAALVKAFDRAEAVFAMLPPNPASHDFRADQERASDAIASAVAQARVPNVVTLSSVGADKASGTGPVAGLNHLEKKLNIIPGLSTVHLRAGYFMENTLPLAGVISKTGMAAGPLPPEVKVPMIATRDIAAAACEELLRVASGKASPGHLVRELLGARDLTYAEAATIIGQAIGRPDLKYVRLPEDQVRSAMIGMGMSENFVKLLLEMAAAIASGHMAALEARTARNTTPTTYETFVRERFLPVYRAQSTAA